MTTSNLPPVQYQQPGGVPRQGNGMAVASLIISLIGICIPIGGLIGLILGFLGLKRAKVTGTGQGLAMAGTVIGGLTLLGWLIAFGLFGTAIFALFKATEGPRLAARSYVTNVSAGNIDAALAESSGLSREEVQAQVDTLKPLGAFKDATLFPAVNNSDAVVSGQAVFANGPKAIAITLVKTDGKWKVTQVQFP